MIERIFLPLIFSLFFSITAFATEGSIDSVQLSFKPKWEIEKISKKIGFDLEENHTSHIPLYSEAIKWLGVRYRSAGMSLKGVDCSGLTSVIYKNVFNKQLQRRSIDISRSIDEEVLKNNLEPGDLVFFATRGRKTINHVGVFLGDRKFIHASVGKGVIISSLDEAYYQRTWRKGGRVALDEQTITKTNRLKKGSEDLFFQFKNNALHSLQISTALSQFALLKEQGLRHPNFPLK